MFILLFRIFIIYAVGIWAISMQSYLDNVYVQIPAISCEKVLCLLAIYEKHKHMQVSMNICGLITSPLPTYFS